MLLVSLNEIAATTEQALIRHRASAAISSLVAHAVKTAEGNGNRICGLYYVESYCAQLVSGRVDGVVEPIIHVDRPGVVRVDGCFGFAQSAFAAGLETALKAARQNGVCTYSVEHSQTCTSLGYFTEQLAQAGMLLSLIHI